jgi:CheY-like chemotaxis protein
MLEKGDRIDILLSDIVMPGEINGYALAEKARQIRPNISILLSSGYQGSDIDKAVSVFPVLRKPYRIGELRAAIDSVLTGKI